MEYLYHYTNIESLALILSNRTIRFNSLDKMDDLQEQEAEDIKNIGKFFYASSWTDNQLESIPMWNMYSSLESGVRIKLRKNPFRLYRNKKEDLEKFPFIEVESKLYNRWVLIPWIDMLNRSFYAPISIEPDDLLYKMEYTDEKDKLYPRVCSLNNQVVDFNLKYLGRYKNSHWEFQYEWRYGFLCYPIDFFRQAYKNQEYMIQFAIDLYKGVAKQPFPYYDLNIDDDAYEDMEITLSPRISLGNRIIVQSLVDKYNSKAVITESALKGLI